MDRLTHRVETLLTGGGNRAACCLILPRTRIANERADLADIERVSKEE